MGAAIAFQAAHRQGKAWQLHDKMFENQKALDPPSIEKYAREIFGLDITRFLKDIDDPSVKLEVLADQKVGNDAGASGTPTLFINGREAVGAQPFEKLQPIIDDEIKKADALIATGTKLADVYKLRCESP